MAKQSTITFRTLGVNGVAQALHLLQMQGFVDVGSIAVTDAAQGEAHYRVERYAKGNGAQVFPFENDRTYISVFRVDTGKPLPAFVSWSGYGTASPDEAITYAQAIIKAAEIAKQMDAKTAPEAAEDKG